MKERSSLSLTIAAFDRPGVRAALCLGVVLMLALGFTGCSRRFFRNRADNDVDATLRDKDNYPQWKVEQYHVYPDPRARFADPSNPDRPPMPPDDPAARNESPRTQRPGKAGIAYIEGAGYLDLLAEWDAQNRAEEQEKAASEASQPAQGGMYGKQPEAAQTKKPFLLKLEQASELALINSREFQDRRENLYLAALPVTVERFAFSTQWFANETAIRERTGKETPEGAHNRWEFNSGFGFTRLFSTGALLLFRLANQTVVEMAGNASPRVVSPSTLSLDVFQPLLRGGGRAVTLEPLTQTERNLLYEMRDYARFRKEFYVALAAGGDFLRLGLNIASFRRFNAPEISGPGAGSAELGIGSGGLISAGSNQFPSLTEGYMPTLLRDAFLDNEEKNVRALEKTLELFKGFMEGGDISQLQVDRVEQQLLQGQSSVLQRQQDYNDSLDRFKLQLGLPTDLPIELDPALLRPQAQQLNRYEQALVDFDAARDAALDYGSPEKGSLPLFVAGMTAQVGIPDTFGPLQASSLLVAGRQERVTGLREFLRKIFTESNLVKPTQIFRTDFPRRWRVWEQTWAAGPGRPGVAAALGIVAVGDELRARMSDLLLERRRLLDLKTDREKENKALTPEEARRLAEVEFEMDLGRFETNLRRYEGRYESRYEDLAWWKREANLLRDVLNDFSLVLGEARNERLDLLRKQWPKLPSLQVEECDLLALEFDDAQRVAGQAALRNRLDLMNGRAALVDAWRQIAVAANSLLGTFNVQYHLDSLTPAGLAKPFAFTGSRTRHQLILSGEAPLVRIQERNNYRAALINWQRQRRNLMAFEDRILLDIRTELRQLRVLAQNYKIQQRVIDLAYMQVENSLDTLRAPAVPGAGGNTAASGAALTQQYLDAQQRLIQAQNQLFTIWVNYLTTRLALYRDIEMMPLDFRGVWTDDAATRRSDADDSPIRSGNADQRDDAVQRASAAQPGPLPAAALQTLEPDR